MKEPDRILKKVIKQRDHLKDLTQEESHLIMRAILKGELPWAKISAFLTAMRIKGETSKELLGFIKAVKEDMKGAGQDTGDGTLDIGTNYDGKVKTIYILPSAIHIANKAGLRITYHHAGRVPAKEGVTLADIFESMGDKYVPEGIQIAHQKEFCGSLYGLMPLRREMGFRTFINVIEKLLNPFGSSYIITSVFHKPYITRMSETIRELGFTGYVIVKGLEGGIEPYPAKPTLFVRSSGEIEEIKPRELNMEMPSSVESDNVIRDSVDINTRIIEGKERGAFYNWAVLCSAMLLTAGGITTSIKEGVELSRGVSYA